MIVGGQTEAHAQLSSTIMSRLTRALSLDINYWSRFVEYPFCPIGCCIPTFEILFTKILDFFNIWVIREN